MIPSHDVYEELRHQAREFGIEKLAALMGVSLGTLYNKLNLSEATTHHKITLADYIQIVTFTKQPTPHYALSGMLGMAAFLLPDMRDQSDEALLDIVNRVHIEGGDVHRALATALAAPAITAEQAQRVRNESLQWIAAILELDARVQGMVSDEPSQ